jgi:hypothetical protein
MLRILKRSIRVIRVIRIIRAESNEVRTKSICVMKIKKRYLDK